MRRRCCVLPLPVFKTLFRTLMRRVLLALSFLALLPQLAAAQNETVIDEIVAVVGDDIVLRSDVDGLLYSMLEQRQMAYSDDLWADALSQLIDEKVLTIHARRDTTIKITDDQVSQGLDQRIEAMTEQVGGQTRLEELYGKSVIEIKADLREQFQAQMAAEELRTRKLRTIKITPSEVSTWFDRIPVDSLPTLPDVVRLAHVVRYPTVTEAARREAMEVISAIRDSVTSGRTPLERMAERFSEDPGSAQQGGRYENTRLSDLVPEFAAVAARITPGDISQIFETQFGLHILRVNARRGDVVDYNHVLITFDQSKADPTAAIALLKVLRDSVLVHKVPFEAIARRHSQEQFSAPRGGRVVDPNSGERDLYLEALGPDWRRTLALMKEGDLSEPAQAQLLDGRTAWHVILLQKRTPTHRVNIETDYALIEQYALREKQSLTLREWVDVLKKSVFIELRGKGQALLGASTAGGVADRTKPLG
jgi:peptidyl-prolyl cis-trans isomerase SurA